TTGTGTTRRRGSTHRLRHNSAIISAFDFWTSGRNVVSKRSLMTIALVVLAGAFAPLYAQGTGAEAGGDVARWSIITAGFALGIAALGGALGQGKSIAAACEAIARNPSATGDIR